MKIQLIQSWRDSDLEQVVRDAVRVLVDIGVRCDHAGTIALLRECGLAEHRNGRLRFDVKRLQAEIDRARANPPPDPSEAMGFGMGGCWPGLNYCDPVTEEVRYLRDMNAAAGRGSHARSSHSLRRRHDDRGGRVWLNGSMFILIDDLSRFGTHWHQERWQSPCPGGV